MIVDFALFLAVNAILFLRPTELIGSAAGWPIYNVFIVLNLLVCLNPILHRLRMSQLARSPSTCCMLGLLAAVGISHVANFDVGRAAAAALEFAKIVGYFLLLLVVINSTRRLRIFLWAVVMLISLLTLVGIVDYLHIVDFPNVQHVAEYYVHYTPHGELVEQSIPRLGAAGLFGDPNDLALVLVAGITLSGGMLIYSRWSAAKLALVPLLLVMGYGLYLTQSRAGLAALLISSLALFYSRYGVARALWAWIPCCVLMIGLFAGRQTDFSQGLVGGGSGTERAGLWSDWLQSGFQHPLWGVGALRGKEVINGRAAHNSYVECFGDMGLFGTLFFVGGLFSALRIMHRMGAYRKQLADRELAALQPALFALLVSFAVNMMALSRCFDVTTYLFLGLAACYEEIAHRTSQAIPRLRFNGRLWQQMSGATVGALLVCYCVMRIAR